MGLFTPICLNNSEPPSFCSVLQRQWIALALGLSLPLSILSSVARAGFCNSLTNHSDRDDNSASSPAAPLSSAYLPNADAIASTLENGSHGGVLSLRVSDLIPEGGANAHPFAAGPAEQLAEVASAIPATDAAPLLIPNPTAAVSGFCGLIVLAILGAIRPLRRVFI